MMSLGQRNRRIRLVQLAMWAVISLIFSGVESMGGTADVPEISPGILMGYLSRDTLPNSLSILPPPPNAGSAAFAHDEAVAKTAIAMRGTPRWALAASDADIMFPQAAGTFSCSLNAPITEADTPHLYMLLRRSLTDAGQSTYAAKNNYKRARPFAVNKQPICSPGDRKRLEGDGSYPSGHAAFGWAWALILSEMAPDRIDAILARGRAFGESRNICNVHWDSDVVGGRLVGAGVVARLHADAMFQADLEAAKAELAAVRAKNLPATRDCAVEAEAMAVRP